ncbi:hypothetical protein [Planctomicrobium piriforme]|uniref:Uncharacterized protein n=1 Tax=Planctomicrobium piriforme TaxID=1576369 RepID=A0A1I3M151_9PLAN|nr:hypothetical protein [Planctomicrobium piriforme]SFI90520.1 hypothetical protein SAMN05421753_113124 [Planctomicrobium piriforme]
MVVSLIFECNTQLARPMATIWLVEGKYDADSEMEIANEPGAVRVIGPLGYTTAVDVYDSVVTLLRSLQISVDEISIADD